MKKNKAGYTANTSRGRVGRGGNACFPTFRIERDGPTDRPTDGRTKPLMESLVRDKKKYPKLIFTLFDLITMY